MKRRNYLRSVLFFCGTALFGMAPLAHAATPNKKKPALPELLTKAKYVCVVSPNGTAYDANVSAPDKRAIADVENAIEAWRMYQIAPGCQQVELIIVVHKAHNGPTAPVDTKPLPPKVSVPLGGPPPAPPLPSVEGGPPEDSLAVCIPDGDGAPGGNLWHRTQKDGLRPPEMSLVAELKKEIQEAIAAQNKKTPAPTPKNSP